MPLFLGVDCGTQGMTAMLVEAAAAAGRARVVFDHSLDFDRALPGFGTTRGVHHGPDGVTVTAPPLMWAAALDRTLGAVAQSGIDLTGLKAVSGSAQQHGTVYLAGDLESAWGRLGRTRAFTEQIAGIFSRDESPVWMDESTRPQCDAIDAALGGPGATARLTGSPATERFAGPQIRKLWQQQPAVYGGTRRIHLVSSFLASLLAGRDAPIEPGDGAGMNLMDIGSCQWSPAALDATAPDLARRLPALAPSWTIAGPLARYWRDRHGLPAASAVAWSGDNPCTLVGMGLVQESSLGISLGTSDTVFAYRRALPSPGAASHVFGSPTGGYMALVCFRNGSLAREAVRDHFGLDWDGFSRALERTPPGNHGALLLPWLVPEITPRVGAGVRSRGLDPDDAAQNVRAIVEAQMMALAEHAGPLGGRCDGIVASGGASANRAILQVMADVFDAPVRQSAGGNAACLGAALRAWHAWALAGGQEISWDAIVSAAATPERGGEVRPIPAHAAIYRDMRRRYSAFEATALRT